MKRHLPNVFTCLNLLSGCAAAVMVFRDHFDWVAYLVFAAAFFDLLDGMAARMLGVNSAYGKELDSLADMVTFGFVPGAILFKMFQYSDFTSWPLDAEVLRIVQFLPFVLTLFSALRLAKFNLDTRQSSSFIGLPTPANTLLVVSFPMILQQFPGMYDSVFSNGCLILVITGILSFLLVSEISLFSLKFNSLSFSENKYQYFLLIASLLLVPLFQWAAIPIIFALYFLFSFLGISKMKKTNNFVQ